MTTHPTREELLQAVIAWLDQPRAAAAHDGYMARVARNALAVVLRDVQLGESADARAALRLQALLESDAPLPTLEHELTARIRDGRMALDNSAMLQHLRMQVRDQLAIDQPRYVHACAA